MERPEAQDYKVELAQRGSGEIGTSYDYLKNTNPTLYYYEKLKAHNNPYVRDDMWSEAARRGETNLLLSKLLQTQGETVMTNEYVQEWEKWITYNDNDYDSYMLALTIPTLDDTKKIDRVTTLEDGTEYSFGEYTDKEWAIQIFEEQKGRWEATKVEEDKKNRTFWEKIGGFLGTVFVSLPLRALGGIADFLGDIYNLFEGIANMFIGWSGDADIGDRFLYAFQNDDWSKVAGDFFRYHAYQFEYYNTSLVDAVDAYDQGYRGLGEGGDLIEQIQNTGIDAGLSGFGKIWAGATQSIGYMLPSMLIPVPGSGAAVKAVDGILSASKVATRLGITAKSLVRQGVFYSGVFSSNITNTLETAKLNGVSYKDLNAGEVIGNAALKAAGQVAMEWALNAIIGTTKLDRWMGMATKSTGKAASKATSELVAAGQWVIRTGKDAVKEGLEEVLQDSSDGLIDLMFGANGNTIFHQQGLDTLNLSNLVDSFIVGAFTSFATGAVADTKYLFKRAYGINAEGQAYKMGAFQTMSFVESMRKMQEWNDIIQNKNANQRLREEAAFKLATTYDTLSKLFTNMGSERVMKAVQIQLNKAAVEETKGQALMAMSKPAYANRLMEDFIEMQGKAKVTYLTQKLKAKIKKAIENKADKLKDGLVTKFKNIFTKGQKVDTESDINTNVQETVIKAVDALKAEAIVGHDGNVVTRSEDVYFVPNSALMEGDIKGILQGVSYEAAVDIVKSQLSENQKTMIVKTYNSVTGLDGNIDDAVTALLFDKHFYCKVLLQSAERRYGTKALTMLATIDKIIANKLSPDVTKGSLTEDAYNVLMKRVRENMRAGLINFATNYVKVDLGEISNEVLPADLKEQIKNHRNVQYTEFINKGKKSLEPVSKADRERFVKALQNCSSKLSEQSIDEILGLLDSNDPYQRQEAYWILSLLSRNAHANDDTKLVYLPEDASSELVAESITAVTNYIGIDWESLVSGEIDATRFTKEFLDYSNAVGGIDWKNPTERFRFLDNLLFEKSGHKLAVDNNGTILRIVDKFEFCKPEYTAYKVGFSKLLSDYKKAVKNGKNLTVQDISKIKLDKRIGSRKIIIDPTLSKVKGLTDATTNDIRLNPVTGSIDSLMHEITHLTQDIVAPTQNTNEVITDTNNMTDVTSTGGSVAAFKNLSSATLKDISNYIKKTYPVYFRYLQSQHLSVPEMIYFTLDGEIKARTTMSTITHDTGFMYANNERTLVSPDRKKSWSLETKESQRIINQFTTLLKDKQQQLNMANKNITTIKATIENIENDLKNAKSADEKANLQNQLDAFNNLLKQYQAQAEEAKAIVNGTKTNKTNKTPRKSKSENKSTQTDANIREDNPLNKDGRYISNKEAAQSNLKYWIKKGRPIQIDPDVKNFVVSTTHDFDKLSKAIKDKIQNGTLTKSDIINFVATASNINDYTFKAIAKYIYKNEEVAKLTFKQMVDIFNNIESLAALAYVVEDRYTKHSLEEIYKIYNEVMKLVDDNSKTYNKDISQKYNNAMENKVSKVKFSKDDIVEVSADIRQLNSIFFNHYNGSIASIRNINNIGKYITALQLPTVLKEHVKRNSDKPWNYITKMKQAEIDYERDDVAKTLDAIDRSDKINTIKNYILNTMTERVNKMSEAQRQALQNNPREFVARINQQIAQLSTLSDVELNKRYLAAIGSEALPENQRGIEGQIKPGEQQTNERTTKNRKDRLRQLGTKITTRIAGLKRRYNSLSELTKQYIDPKTYKLTPEYRNLSDAELDNLIEAFAKDAKKLRQNIARSDMLKDNKKKTEERMERMARKNMTSKGTEVKEKPKSKQTLREKVQVQHKIVIKEQKFEFVSPTESNQVVKELLNTNFSREAMSKVQGLSNNQDENVTSGKEFFENNAGTFLNASLSDIEQAVLWFLDVRMNNVSSDEFKKFQAVKLFFLSYVLSQAKPGGVYEGLNNNIKQRIENAIKTEVTAAGTTLSSWNQMLAIIDPAKSFVRTDIEIDGVTLSEDEKTMLFDAIMSNDVDKIREAQLKIYDTIAKQKPKTRSILRRISAFRSMSMLSSPMTWLRNKVSNMALKRIYRMADAIGRNLFKRKHIEGQLKLNKQVTPEIQAFINEHFIDNKLFDTFVGQLSRYNPSDITNKKMANGQLTKEQIMTRLVLKAMYSEYYNNEVFKSPLMKQLHSKLMKVMSDNSYVRESAVRIFGKILAEKGYDLSKNEVTDAIMNDFSVSIGMAMSEYMHSDNLFNQIEKWLGERTELGLFTYKLLMPYASSSWNWFKAMIKMSPIGLGRAIINMYRLEKNIAKQETMFLTGKSQISGQFAEYMARRDLGQGVIGTIAWGVGMLLAGLGFIQLDDDDYGVPKIRIGNVEIDVSSIFGSSSLLAGAALVAQVQKNGLDWDGFVSGLDAMADVWIDQMPIMDIVEMDMYSNGGFSIGMDKLESIALSFIPNIVSWLAGATYTGTLNKQTFLDRAMAKIPFLANLVEKKVDPYTGDTGSWIDILNRVIPYFSIDSASENEQKTNELGLNKSQLRGTYNINGEDFTVTGSKLTEINRAYGEWNADELTQFYNNQLLVKVKSGNGYRTLRYSQMTDEQRKNAVQSIMENNAELAKIIAWLNAGNKYYASATIYNKLRRAGYTKNLYRGTKGFVKG